MNLLKIVSIIFLQLVLIIKTTFANENLIDINGPQRGKLKLRFRKNENFSVLLLILL